jgi:hypothetical protein
MISWTLVISMPYSSWSSRKLTNCIVPMPPPNRPLCVGASVVEAKVELPLTE